MGIENFNRTIDLWIKALERYDYIQLNARPSTTSWSIGQVYMHLLDDATYYREQIELCVTSNDHANEDASPAGRTMLLNNDFPDEVLEGAPSNAYMPQPKSKEKLKKDLLNLKAEMNNVATLISESPFHGKTCIPDWITLALTNGFSLPTCISVII